MGAQGRLFEVYDDTIVMIDTFLAKVTYVADITYDAQGHVKTPATITLEVYDAKNASTPLTLKDYDDNYGYAKDEYVLVNARCSTLLISMPRSFPRPLLLTALRA